MSLNMECDSKWNVNQNGMLLKSRTGHSRAPQGLPGPTGPSWAFPGPTGPPGPHTTRRGRPPPHYFRECEAYCAGIIVGESPKRTPANPGVSLVWRASLSDTAAAALLLLLQHTRALAF